MEEDPEGLRRYMQTLQGVLPNLKSPKGMAKLMSSYQLYLKEMEKAEANDDEEEEVEEEEEEY